MTIQTEHMTDLYQESSVGLWLERAQAPAFAELCTAPRHQVLTVSVGIQEPNFLYGHTQGWYDVLATVRLSSMTFGFATSRRGD